MRTVLLGMNNPLSTKPMYALYPHPVNCTGWRVWRMLQEAAQEFGLKEIGASAYCRAFDRRNVLNSVEWTASVARERGLSVMDVLVGRRVMIFGVQTAKAVRVPRREWGVWFEHHHLPIPTEVCLLPHPSGRCREYNDETFRASVGRLLLKEYLRAPAEGKLSR